MSSNNDRVHAELSERRDSPSAELIREHMRQLRKVLAGSRYQIVNYRSLGYELIVADASDAFATALASPATPHHFAPAGASRAQRSLKIR